ncbi:MAG: HPr-rel-A system PqqD family peptide chaperone [Gammaproteobacteria bacterium]|nr:HPr-rel-A system PqqD family peptide chaperone [Gammaproteobacteria bacterium]
MSFSPNEVWFVTPGCEILGRHWPEAAAQAGMETDDLFLVFHTGSGDTHAVDAFRFFVLSSLKAPGLRVAELCRRVAQHLELPPEEFGQTELHALLSDLYGLGLLDYRIGEAEA